MKTNNWFFICIISIITIVTMVSLGLSENQKFFMHNFKNIYGIENLDSLNRENKEKDR